MRHDTLPVPSPRTSLRAVLVLVVLLVAAGPLGAYTIYLKDGSTLQAREKYKQQGSTALITLPSGAQSTLPMAQIDVERTQRGNATDFGNATVMEEPAAPKPATEQKPKGASLAELAAQRRVAPMPTGPSTTTSAPAPERAAVAEPARGTVPKTPAGFVDFFHTPRSPVSRTELQAAVAELLRAHGVANAGVYAGSQSRRVLVEVPVNSEGAVFQAIGATAQALLGLEAKGIRNIDAIELFLATDHRQRAGQFLITPERAHELVGKKIDLTQFYVRYVEF